MLAVATFRVLFVCVGNVCRSPLGERLLAARLPDGFEVSSAGVGALVGEPMNPDAVVHLEALGLSADGFVARQLVPPMVAESDLVLTATKAIRSRVLEESPGALRRTFTVLELAALLSLPDVGSADGPGETVRTAAAQRSRAELEDYDIPDPFRRGEEAHSTAADLMAKAVERIAAGLTT